MRTKVRIELIDDDGKVYIGEAALHEGSPTRIASPVKPTGPKHSLALPDRIIALRDKGFFSQPKVSPEVYKEITKTYYCQRDRVTMALIRLQKGQQLRKASKLYDGKKMNAYVW